MKLSPLSSNFSVCHEYTECGNPVARQNIDTFPLSSTLIFASRLGREGTGWKPVAFGWTPLKHPGTWWAARRQMLSEFFDHKTYLVPDNPFDNVWVMKKQNIKNNMTPNHVAGEDSRLTFVFSSGNTPYNAIHGSSVLDEEEGALLTRLYCFLTVSACAAYFCNLSFLFTSGLLPGNPYWPWAVAILNFRFFN